MNSINQYSQQAMQRVATAEVSVQRQAHCGSTLAAEAKAIRRDIVETLYQTGGGHYGGALSVTDILLTLYRRQLRLCPAIPRHAQRDRLILSKGHAAVALYAMLRRLAYFDAPLAEYASFDSILEGHPDMASVPGIDFSSGSLGQGLSVGIGMALALRTSGQQVWVVLGDGECQEGQIWEAAMLAANCQLSNLCAIVDCNLYQEWGWAATKDEAHPPPVSQMRHKWQAFGWRVIEVDGHDHAALEAAYQTAMPSTTNQATTGQPTVILANTNKGHGVPLIANAPWRFHCETVTEAEHASILESLR